MNSLKTFALLGIISLALASGMISEASAIPCWHGIADKCLPRCATGDWVCNLIAY